MAGAVNQVTILGHLGRDPETRNFQNGGSVTNLRVATSERWKDKQGEWQERTEWHSVAIFGPLAEVASKHLRKGSKVFLQGKLQTRKWADKDGQDRYTTEVVLNGFGAQLCLLDAKGANGGGGQPGGQQAAPSGAGSASGDYGATDDDMPF